MPASQLQWDTSVIHGETKVSKSFRLYRTSYSIRLATPGDTRAPRTEMIATRRLSAGPEQAGEFVRQMDILEKGASISKNFAIPFETRLIDRRWQS